MAFRRKVEVQIFMRLLATSACVVQLLLMMAAPPPTRAGGVPYPDNKFRYILQRSLYDPVWSSLNSSIIPSHYNVELVINDGNDPHHSSGDSSHALPPTDNLRVIEYGKVRIAGVNQVANTSTVTLHYKELEINHTSVTVIGGPNKSPIPVRFITENPDLHWFTITLDGVLQAGDPLTIFMEFRSTPYEFADWGPRYSEHLLANGARKRYVTPYGGGFRKTIHDFYTRAIFPLFDEPHLQATFQLTMVHREGYRALSNTHVLVSNIPDTSRPGWVKDRFYKTIRMSPHMFSFVLSDLPFMKVTTSQNKLIRFHAPQQILEHAQDDVEYLMEVAARLFSFHDQFFQGSKYSPRKMDIVWRDSSHAKVAWGLYIDEGRYLLRESEHYTSDLHDDPHYRQFILERISFPFAHQWQWHSKRELVKYMKLLGFESVTPEYLWAGRLERMITCSLQEHLVQDTGLPYARRYCDQMVHNTGGFGKYDVREVLLYRMLEGFLGRRTFRLGMQKFLENGPLYDVMANERVLLTSMEEAIRENKLDSLLPPNGTSLVDVLQSWRERKDLAIVKVYQTNGTCVNISQERYHGKRQTLVDEHGKGENGTTGLWMIPIRVVIGGEKGHRVKETETQMKLWLGNNGQQTCIPGGDQLPSWIKINNNATGYYRTLYDNELLKRIKDQLESDHTVITPMTRTQLLDDYMYMAYAGKVSIQTALNLTRYLDNETDSAVWTSFLSHLSFLYNDLHFYRHPEYPAFQNYLKPKFNTALRSISLDEKITDPASLIEYRQDLLQWACRMGNQVCLDHISKFLRLWKQNPERNPFATSTGFGMVSLVGMSGGEEGFEFLLEEFFHPPSNDNLNGTDDFVLRWKAAMMNGITQVSDARLLERLLNYTLDPNSTLSSVNYFDSVYWDVRSNRLYRGILLHFLLDHADRIVEHVKLLHNDSEPVSAWFNLVQLIGATVEDEQEMQMVKNFFKENDLRFYESFKNSSRPDSAFFEEMDLDAWSSQTMTNLEEGRQEYSEAAGNDRRMRKVIQDVAQWINVYLK